jgi:hypothetical protein
LRAGAAAYHPYLLFSLRPRASSSPLQRVYRAKFALVAVSSTFLGIALIVLAHWAAVDPSGAWLRTWPVNEFGLGLFTTGLFGVLLQYVGQRDAEEEQLDRLRHVIAEDLAARPDGLVTMVSTETRDRIAENCLRLQLGDEALAHDLYADLREQLMRTGERREDMDVSMALAPWPDGPSSGRGAMFVATIRTEYRIASASPVMRFACVSDLDEYRELLQDPSCTVVHYFQPVEELELHGGSERAFQFVELTVDGRRRPARRTTRAGAQVFTVSLGSDMAIARRTLAISYTYRVLIQQQSHLLELDISRPTKGLRVQLAYGGCGIRRVNVADYIASSRQPGLRQLPPSGPTPSVALRWVDPSQSRRRVRLGVATRDGVVDL